MGNQKNIIIYLFIGIILLVILLIALLIYFTFPNLEENTKTAILGAAVGSIGGVLVSLTTSIISIWRGNQEKEERQKERVSKHVLELTKLEYELRQKTLNISKTKKKFYAPIKIYRELFIAILEFENTGIWPDNINKMGLLNMVELGPDEIE